VTTNGERKAPLEELIGASGEAIYKIVGAHAPKKIKLIE
jgi:hypothetical protein